MVDNVCAGKIVPAKRFTSGIFTYVLYRYHYYYYFVGTCLLQRLTLLHTTHGLHFYFFILANRPDITVMADWA